MAYFITSDGCRLYYRVKIAGSAANWIVFLNGTAQAAVQWLPTGRAFTSEYNTLVYDARAQGKSDLGSVPLGLSQHTADLKALMSHLDIDAASLVGLSHGALVGLYAAADGTDRIQRMVLCSIGFAASPINRIVTRSWQEIIRRGGIAALAWAMLPIIMGPEFLAKNRHAVDDMVSAMVRRNRRQSLEAHFKAVLQYPSMIQRLKQIDIPCLLVNGADDPLTSGNALSWVTGLSHVQTVTLHKCGHSCPIEAPRRFGACVKDFLSTTR